VKIEGGAASTAEQVAVNPRSFTGGYLKPMLARHGERS
jgi:hypothetical protein